MHSAIEFAKKKTAIYIPSQWVTIIRMARRTNPYYVVPLQFEDIYDFKEVTKSTLKYSSRQEGNANNKPPRKSGGGRQEGNANKKPTRKSGGGRQEWNPNNKPTRNHHSSS
jgi:hypothetical protein